MKSPTVSLVQETCEQIFKLHAEWIEEHGDAPIVYFFLHQDGALEPWCLMDGEETTKEALSHAVTQQCIRLTWQGRRPQATFLAADVWMAMVAPEERDPLSTPASKRLNRREAIIVSTFTPEQANVIGRFYRRDGRRIIWEEPVPDSTINASLRYESRFDPWASKRKAH